MRNSLRRRATIRIAKHHLNFINGIRTGTPHFENGVFGLRAAAPALLVQHELL